MKVTRKEVKSLLTKSNLPEADYVINPYIGCQHGCSYCYADFMKRFTGHSGERWGEFIDVKTNGPETIKRVKPGSTIVIGSVTDPYQPIEAKEQLTRRTLQHLVLHQPRLEIITKSPLILRDVDLLKQFNNLKVGMSIGILNDEYARELEPYAPSPSNRLDALRKLHKEGIFTYLFMSPILPEFSEIGPLIKKAKRFVDEIYFENLNIRANNRKAVLEFVAKHKPELVEFYKGLSKNREYWDRVESRIVEKCKCDGIKYRMFFHHRK